MLACDSEYMSQPESNGHILWLPGLPRSVDLWNSVCARNTYRLVSLDETMPRCCGEKEKVLGGERATNDVQKRKSDRPLHDKRN
jgi:hypothetical protein